MAHSILSQDLAFVDIETTGSFATQDKITEIGILRVSKGKLVKTYQTLVNPQVSITPDITRITGITDEMVKDAPTFSQVKNTVHEHLKDAVFIAHNVAFDYSFVSGALRQYQIPYAAGQLCTVKLSRFLYPTFQRHNLDSVASRFNFTIKNRHRAFDDAAVLWEFFQQILKTFDDYTISLAFDQIYKPPEKVVLPKIEEGTQMSLI